MTGARHGTPAGVRVVKLGGSLLCWVSMPARVRLWLQAQSPAKNVLVVGGGGVVDALRAWDRVHSLKPSDTHHLAVRAMRLSAELVARLLPEAKLVDSIALLSVPGPESLHILDVEPFLREDRNAPGALSETWDVTSDSIAARVATVLGAEEVVLLKSTLPTEHASRDCCAQTGFVDAYFPRAADGLAVRCVNLRDEQFRQVMI